ncbi:MAG: hypothetical protein ACJAW3_000195 [Lentimonas sp.]
MSNFASRNRKFNRNETVVDNLLNAIEENDGRLFTDGLKEILESDFSRDKEIEIVY